MITLTAKINLLSTANGVLSGATSNLSGNNLSSEIGAILGVKQRVGNPFIIGINKIGDGSTISGKLNYFMGDQIADQNGNFANPYLFNVQGNGLNAITFAFDDTHHRHPKKIKVVSYEGYASFETKSSSGISIGSPDMGYWAMGSVSFDTPTPITSAVGVLSITKALGVEITSIENNLVRWKYQTFSANQTVNVEITAYYEDFMPIEETYAVDDALFTLSKPTANGYIVEIDDWNTPNSLLVLTGIYVDITIDIDRRNLVGIDETIYDRSDLKLPSYGVKSNMGNLSFNDLDGEIKDYAEQLLLGSDLNVNIYINNTLNKKSELVGVFKTDTWDYDNYNRNVEVSLKDDLLEWQEINMPRINYDPNNPTHQNFEWLYRQIYAFTVQNGYDMLSFDELDEQTQSVLTNNYMQYPFLEPASLWAQWDKFGKATLTHIFKKGNGKIVCKYNGGN